MDNTNSFGAQLKDLFGVYRLDKHRLEVYDLKQLLPFINALPDVTRKLLNDPFHFWHTILYAHFYEYEPIFKYIDLSSAQACKYMLAWMTYAHRRILKYMARVINPDDLRWRSGVCNANWIEYRGTLIHRRELAEKLGCYGNMLLDFSHPVNQDGAKTQGILREIFGIDLQKEYAITSGWHPKLENEKLGPVIKAITGKCKVRSISSYKEKSVCMQFVWDVNRLLSDNNRARARAQNVFRNKSNYLVVYPYKNQFEEPHSSSDEEETWWPKAKKKVQNRKILYLGDTLVCASCNIPDKPVMMCEDCMEIVYCGTTCQLFDWKNHMLTCHKK